MKEISRKFSLLEFRDVLFMKRETLVARYLIWRQLYRDDDLTDDFRGRGRERGV